jgi:DNA repair exonuclease SbcCD ATPase subunit
MIVVRISAAQRQRADFWAGLQRRVLRFVHPSVLHAGDPIDLDLRLFEDQPPLRVGGVVVSCEKRHIDNRDLFRVNCLLDRNSDAVELELDRHIAAHGGDVPPPEPSPSLSPSVSHAADTAPPPRPSSPGFRAVADALVAERTRLVEAEREITSLKSYVQSLENQLLDVRLTPAGTDPFAGDHTPAYGTPIVDFNAARPSDAEREAHAATLRQLEETRSRLQLIEAGAVGTHQALTHQVEGLSHQLNAAQAEVAKVRAQAETEKAQDATKTSALEGAISAMREASAKIEREAAEREKALEEKLAIASDAATVAGKEATERQKAAEEKLAAANEALASAARTAGEREKALEDKFAAALERQKSLEERLVAGETQQAAERQTAEKLKQVEEQLALATTGLLAAEKEAAEVQKARADAASAAERARALEAELAALKTSSAEAQAKLTTRLEEADQKLKLVVGDESAATAAAEAANERVRKLELDLAAAQQALEAEGIKAASEAARANAEKAAFAVQEQRLAALEEERATLARRVATLEGDAAAGRKTADDELEALRATGRAAKETAEARQRALEQELTGLAARVASAPRGPPVSSAPAEAPAPPPPSAANDALEARVQSAEARVTEVTREREFLAAKTTELERELSKARASAAPKPSGFAIQAADREEASGSSPLVRWLVSMLVCGGIAAAVVAWMGRAH